MQPLSLSGRRVAPSRRVAARAAQPSQPVLLPNALWVSADASALPVYGPQFVIQREQRGPPHQELPQAGPAGEASPAAPRLTQQDALDASLSAALGSALPLVYSPRHLGLVQVAEQAVGMVPFEAEREASEVIDVEPVEQSAGTPFIEPLGAGSALCLPPGEVGGGAAAGGCLAAGRPAMLARRRRQRGAPRAAGPPSSGPRACPSPHLPFGRRAGAQGL
jgi:hypothetical protein